MNTANPPDAVRSPLRFAGEGDTYVRLLRLQAEFSAILRAPRVYVRHQGTEHFISGDPNDSIRLDQASARPGAPRYSWEDRGDGVLYGRLIPDVIAP